jgi:hypothetical protein
MVNNISESLASPLTAESREAKAFTGRAKRKKKLNIEPDGQLG